MLQHFFLTVAVIIQLMNVGIPEALQAAEVVYIVPTVESGVVALEGDQQLAIDRFRWRLEMKKEVAVQLPIVEQPPVPRGTLEGPSIEAGAAIVVDEATGQVLWQKNPDDVLSMASITKLMTALTWFDYQPAAGLEHIHTFAPEDNAPLGKELNLPYGTQLTAFNLLRTSIIASDNDTALALAHTTGLSDEEFVAAMNKKALELGMTSAQFVDQTGLGQGNMATVSDIAKMGIAAFSNPDIAEPAGMKIHLQETVDGAIFSRVTTTNKLLYDDSIQVIAGKTGFIDEAGYCLIIKTQVPNSDRSIITVVLGTDSDEARFVETKKLLDWAFETYDWN